MSPHDFIEPHWKTALLLQRIVMVNEVNKQNPRKKDFRGFEKIAVLLVPNGAMVPVLAVIFFLDASRHKKTYN